MQSGSTLFQRNEYMESWFQSLGRLSLGLAFCKVSWQFFFLKFQFEVYNYLVLNPKILKATAEIKTCGWPLQNLKTQVSQSKCSVHSLGTEPQTCESTIWNQNLKIGHSTVFFQEQIWSSKRLVLNSKIGKAPVQAKISQLTTPFFKYHSIVKQNGSSRIWVPNSKIRRLHLKSKSES